MKADEKPDSFHSSAIVEQHGQLHLGGLPFAPGTEVEVIIHPKASTQQNAPSTVQRAEPTDEAIAVARSRMQELFRTVKGFRASPKIPREDLYDRGSLR